MLAKKKQPAPEPTLKEQIEAIRAEAEALVERRVAELKKIAPNVPIEVIKQQVTGRDLGCSCRTLIRLMEGD